MTAPTGGGFAGSRDRCGRGCGGASAISARAGRSTDRRRWSSPASSPTTAPRWSCAARSPAPGFRVHPWRQRAGTRARRADTHRAAQSFARPGRRRSAGAAGRLEPWRSVRARAGARSAGAGARGGDAGLAFLRRPARSTMSGGSTSGSPAIRSIGRRSAHSPTSRRCRRLAIWSRRDGIVAAARRAALPDESDKAVEIGSSHMGFGVSRRGTRAAVREIVRFLRAKIARRREFAPFDSMPGRARERQEQK